MTMLRKLEKYVAWRHLARKGIISLPAQELVHAGRYQMFPDRREQLVIIANV